MDEINISNLESDNLKMLMMLQAGQMSNFEIIETDAKRQQQQFFEETMS